MGIYSAIATSVSGLRAQSTALEHISGNIANSQTTGYKRTETNFADLVADGPPDTQSATGVLASSRSTNSVQGDILGSDIETYIAIDGEGFFIVSEKLGEIDNNLAFSDTDLYTRRGDFTTDKYGYLVNGAGYYLQGLAVDANTGNISGSVPEPIRISGDFLEAEATTEIVYRANLAKYPLTANADEDVPGSEFLDPADFNNDPTASGDGFVQGQDETAFINSTISGGAITAYDSSGSTVNVQIRWAKLDDDTYNMFYLEDSTATGTDPMWRNVGTDYDFNASRQLDPDFGSVTITGMTVDGVTLGDITIQHGSAGITSFSDANGTAKVTELSQNGYPAGELESVAISDSGRVTAFYTNGEQLEIAEVGIATFNAPDELRKVDGGAFLATTESGTPIIGGSGNIIGSALEASNTDIADEFSKLIITQQAYTANSRIITTSDEMLQEALNIVR
ncbi:flagellar hook protein FlgE [Rhodobium orientis]|uniref:Flagellar hook protein FlgE n=1 Tax=Rhodobium orientis TaxID=34017 RepID=A0A327JFQ0_9HYPH|nr:flagellar hook-basal body complex protein [Rhodobium orientis]MBB4301840.1 flagellar hook protein FlgE [Rhodobium orientis]MBK5948385.1 hypothetical protein [Rhodobium orientis]RAI25217.1 hypothetical protein CH339_19275 [Rhodobium orientis]